MNRKGFTLLELVIAIAVIALVVTIALPSYQSSIQKSRRAAAQTELLGFTNTAERFFTERGTYNDDGETPTLPADSDYYTFSFPEQPGSTSYTIQAVPKSDSPQVSDKCGTMTLSNTGARSSSGTETDCWGTSSS